VHVRDGKHTRNGVGNAAPAAAAAAAGAACLTPEGWREQRNVNVGASAACRVPNPQWAIGKSCWRQVITQKLRGKGSHRKGIESEFGLKGVIGPRESSRSTEGRAGVRLKMRWDGMGKEGSDACRTQ
jgi:hypothetical protein